MTPRVKSIIKSYSLQTALLCFLFWFLPSTLIFTFFPGAADDAFLVGQLGILKWASLVLAICIGGVKLRNALLGKDAKLNAKMDRVFGKN